MRPLPAAASAVYYNQGAPTGDECDHRLPSLALPSLYQPVSCDGSVDGNELWPTGADQAHHFHPQTITESLTTTVMSGDGWLKVCRHLMVDSVMDSRWCCWMVDDRFWLACRSWALWIADGTWGRWNRTHYQTVMVHVWWWLLMLDGTCWWYLLMLMIAYGGW